jgi:hypothetical protein
VTRVEAILAARAKKQVGGFYRKIIRATPCDLETDVIELECGHTRKQMESSRKLDESMRGLQRKVGTAAAPLTASIAVSAPKSGSFAIPMPRLMEMRWSAWAGAKPA